jgi:hypothetical protein
VLTPLEQWRLTHFGTTANTGASADTADFDGDGLTNLLEYALGSTPTSLASAAPPNVRITNIAPPRLEISFFRARPSAELTYTVEASSNLVTWTTLASNPGIVGQSVTVTDTVDLPTANPPRRFLRLRVAVP